MLCLQSLTWRCPILNLTSIWNSAILPKRFEPLGVFDTASLKRSWGNLDFWIAHVKLRSSDLSGCGQLLCWAKSWISDWLTGILIVSGPEIFSEARVNWTWWPGVSFQKHVLCIQLLPGAGNILVCLAVTPNQGGAWAPPGRRAGVLWWGRLVQRLLLL